MRIINIGGGYSLFIYFYYLALPEFYSSYETFINKPSESQMPYYFLYMLTTHTAYTYYQCSSYAVRRMTN